MIRKVTRLVILSMLLCMVGCQTDSSHSDAESNHSSHAEKKDGEKDMNEKDIFNFKNIEHAPEATEDHSLSAVIKVFFDESSFDEPYQSIAVDIGNNEIYVNPIISQRGLRAQDGVLDINDGKGIISILEKYQIQDWKTDYTDADAEEAEDGESWALILQYEDGSVKKHIGNDEDLTPEGFREFADELYQFVENHLE